MAQDLAQVLKEYEKPDFDRVNSRLILCVGSSDEDFVFLETMFESVKGRQNYSEWRSRLSKTLNYGHFGWTKLKSFLRKDNL